MFSNFYLTRAFY